MKVASPSLLPPRNLLERQAKEPARRLRREQNQPDPRFHGQPRAWSAAAIGVTVAGVIYNGVLAFLLAHGFRLNTSIVALSEMLILGGAVALIVLTRFSAKDIIPAAFGYFGLCIGVAMSLMNGRVYPDGTRIFLIIAVFVLLGSRLNVKQIDRCFIILTSIVFAFLLIELTSTPLYVSLFQPANYFEVTRGIEKFALNKTGLFAATLGFQGRLSLNPFSQFRTGSIFLEQVSLANYGGVLIVYLLTRWSSLILRTKIFYAVVLVLILLTTSTRTSTSLAILGVLGYWIYPRFSRFATLALAPLLLLTSWVLVLYFGSSAADDVVGRLSRTITLLGSSGADGLLGMRVELLPMFGDSGYTYLVFSTTIFGAIALWLFVSLVLQQATVAEKRCAWATAFYIFINLLISGTAVFSMKTAAPLWLLLGCMYGSSPNGNNNRYNNTRAAEAVHPAKVESIVIT